MLDILAGVEGMMDDILIHGQTKAEHDERLTQVLHRLQDAGLTLNRDKSRAVSPFWVISSTEKGFSQTQAR